MAVSIEQEMWFWDRVREGVCTIDDKEDFDDMFGGECFYPYTYDDFLDFVKEHS